MRSPLFTLTVATALMIPALVAASSDAAQEARDAVQSHPDLNHGAKVFQTCAACHGTSGGGTVDGGIPRIAGQHFSVLVKQLVDYRHNRRWDPRMETLAKGHELHNAQDIADVAAYASEIETVPDASVGVGSGEFLSQGTELYGRACAACHGAAGDGDAQQQIPRVAGQNFAYLVRQIHDAVEGRRPNFSAAHIRLLKQLDYTGILGVSDYLSRIPRRADPIMPHDWASDQGGGNNRSPGAAALGGSANIAAAR